MFYYLVINQQATAALFHPRRRLDPLTPIIRFFLIPLLMTHFPPLLCQTPPHLPPPPPSISPPPPAVAPCLCNGQMGCSRATEPSLLLPTDKKKEMRRTMWVDINSYTCIDLRIGIRLGNGRAHVSALQNAGESRQSRGCRRRQSEKNLFFPPAACCPSANSIVSK